MLHSNVFIVPWRKEGEWQSKGLKHKAEMKDGRKQNWQYSETEVKMWTSIKEVFIVFYCSIS